MGTPATATIIPLGAIHTETDFTFQSKFDITNFNCTDSGNALLFARLWGNKVRYDHTANEWYTFEGHTWKKVQGGKIDRLMLEATNKRLEHSVKIQDQDQRQRHAKWALNSESDYLIKASLNRAKKVKPIDFSRDQFDRDPFLLGCRNGIINLRNGKLLHGTPDHLISKSTGINFDPQATCPRWERFLDEVFEGNNDLINFIQLAIGYSLTGDVSEQKFFALYGSGANGKSTFLTVMTNLLGDYIGNAAAETFILNKFNNDGSNNVADLFGKRFVTYSELRENSRWNEARLKMLSGGDVVTARQLYQKNFTFKPAFKIWFSFNHKPSTSDNSDAFWRRVCLVPFKRKFSIDNKLEGILLNELPGILTWGVGGCLAWQQERQKEGQTEGGLCIPNIVKSEVKAYQKENNTINQFFDENVTMEKSAKTEAAVLYQRYKTWCEANGEYTLTHKKLGTKLNEMNIESDRFFENGKQSLFYIGLKLNE